MDPSNLMFLFAPSAYWSLLAFACYLVLVRALRYRRRDHLQYSFNYPTRASYARMTIEDAHAIQLALARLEFPQTFTNSVFFALFKTYGIPTISKLLVATGELASETTASKRATDTGVILTEVMYNLPDSDRAVDGIARMNYLHERYRKAGKILDEDMLYALGLFALQPAKWTAAYEWRSMTDLERCAMGTYWKDIGDKMGIPYAMLPSSKAGWRDGLHWLEEVDVWCEEYEESCMVPADSNARLATGTLDILLFSVPRKLRSMTESLVAAILGERLRRAMKFEEPSDIHFTILHTSLAVRKFALRHLFLPRPYLLRRKWSTDRPDPQTGCFHSLIYFSHPWYVKPTVRSRWGFEAICTSLLRGVVPGDEGEKYMPEGYRIAELGPKSAARKGDAEMNAMRAALRRGRSSCPFATAPS